jgi:uncharacterized membrane protein YbhN (UPF0104 family)
VTTRSRKALSWTLSIFVSGILLYYSLRGVEWAQVWRIIVGAQWQYFAAGAGITTVSFFLRAVRWRILLNAEDRLGVGLVFCANMAGYLANSFLPARAGEVVRSLLISSRSSLTKTYVLTTALSERLMDVIALVLCSSVVLLGVSNKPGWLDNASGTMAALALAGGLAIAILPHTGKWVETIVRRLPMPGSIRPRILSLTGQVLLGLRAFHHWGRFAGFASLTIVIWFTDACGTIVGAKGLGLDLSFPVALLLLSGMGLGSALPSTPGYVGVYQFVAVTVLTPFGIGRDAALAFILVTQAVGYVVVMGLGLPGLYVLQGAGALRQASSAGASEIG